MEVRVLRPDERAAALALVGRQGPSAARSCGAATWTAALDEDGSLGGVLARDGAMIVGLAGSETALAALLSTPVEGLRTTGALLWDHPDSAVHHRILRGAGLVPEAEISRFQVDLWEVGAPRLAWTRVDDPTAAMALVLELAADSGNRYGGPGDPEWVAALRAIEPSVRSGLWFLGALEGKIAGVVATQPLEGRGLAGVFVGLKPAYRGRGLGVELLRAGLQHGRSRGAVWYVDDADIRNIAAVKMLQRAGMHDLGRLRRYRAPQPSSS